jgi:hypothetical protein
LIGPFSGTGGVARRLDLGTTSQAGRPSVSARRRQLASHLHVSIYRLVDEHAYGPSADLHAVVKLCRFVGVASHRFMQYALTALTHSSLLPSLIASVSLLLITIIDEGRPRAVASL